LARLDALDLDLLAGLDAVLAHEFGRKYNVASFGNEGYHFSSLTPFDQKLKRSFVVGFRQVVRKRPEQAASLAGVTFGASFQCPNRAQDARRFGRIANEKMLALLQRFEPQFLELIERPFRRLGQFAHTR
jgi:hypothetical protein